MSSSSTIQAEDFTAAYIAVRKLENRLYEDEEVLRLPVVGSSHLHSAEWAIRSKSCSALKKYFSRKKRPLQLLEAGCGNGWLCNQLADIKDATVTGTDINTTELEQAARVFKQVPNLGFIYTDLRSIAAEKKYDAVIFAASIQYFSSFAEIAAAALRLVVPSGEVHIIDSPFYANNEAAEAAAERSLSHYKLLGQPQMAAGYHHHTMQVLSACQYKLQYNPAGWLSRLRRPYNPFPWIIIKNNTQHV